jgi:hypothetical protein
MLNIRLFLRGREYNLSDVPRECTITNLKRVIAPTAGISIRQMRLLRNGRQLPDDVTLLEQGLVAPDVVYDMTIIPRDMGYSPFPGWKPVSRLDPDIGGIRVNGNLLPIRPLAPHFDGTLWREKFWFPLNYINHTPGCDIPVTHALLQQFYDNCIAQPFQTIEQIGTAILLANGYRADHFWFEPDSLATFAHHNPPVANVWQFQPPALALPVVQWPVLVQPEHEVPAQAGPIIGLGVDQRTTPSIRGWMCSICMENETVNGNVIYTVPCGHKFHVGCITPWIGTNNTCPFCRSNITGYSNVSIAEHTQGKRKTYKKRKSKKRSNKKH